MNNLEFEKLLQNACIYNIITTVCNKYRKQLSKDELYQCGCMALWKCINKYDDKFGQKFTSSLYRLLNWECLNEIRNTKCKLLSLNTDIIDTKNNVNLNEYLDGIPVQDINLLLQYYIGKYTLKELGGQMGYSPQGIHHKLKKIVYNIYERGL